MDRKDDAKGRFRIEALEDRIAPTILVTNPAGNHPQSGSALNGQAIDNQNPAGHAPRCELG